MDEPAIDILHDDVLGLVLREAREYRPALVGVCRHWAALAAELLRGDAVLRPRDLAARGHGSLLAELDTLWPFVLRPEGRGVLPVVREAARAGMSAFCARFLALGPDCALHAPLRIRAQILIGAAQGGQLELARAAHASSGSPNPLGGGLACGSPCEESNVAARAAYFRALADTIGPYKSICRHELDGHCEAFRCALRGGHIGICDLLAGCVQMGHDAVGRWSGCVGACARAAEARDLEAGWPFGGPSAMRQYLAERRRLGGELCDLDDPSALLLAAALGGSEFLCRRAWAAWKAEPRSEAEGASQWLVGAMLARAAEGGHVALCELAVEWGADSSAAVLAQLGAAAGSADVCALARRLAGDRLSAHQMAYAAVDRGNETLVRLAIEWGALGHDPAHWRQLLKIAAALGHTDICSLLRASGTQERRHQHYAYDSMLSAAVKEQQWAAALLALQWGANVETLFDRDQSISAYCAIKLFCIAADRTGAYSLDGVLAAAAAGHSDTGKGSAGRLSEFGYAHGPDVCEVLLRACAPGSARAASAGSLLRCALSRHWREYCGLAVDFGARNFAGMLAAALGARNAEMAALARHWGGEALR